MVQETIKVVQEAEAKADEILKNAGTQCAEIVEAAKGEAKQLKEAKIKEAKDQAQKAMEVSKKESEKTMKSVETDIQKEIAALKKSAAKKEAQDYTDGKLTEYSTTEETKSLISQSAEQITLEVSKTYATQGQLDGYTKKSEVRSRFAMDASNVTIDTGRLTFNSNTIVINSTNFKLDASGNVTAAGTFKSVSDKWEATLRYGGLFMNYDGNRRVELFKAGNYDGGYLRLSGTYNGEDAMATYAPNSIAMGSPSKSAIMTPEYISLTENSKSRFTITQGVNDGVPVSNSALVQSPDGDVMARLMCGNVQGAPQAKLEFLYKVDNILWTVMNLTYDGSKNRVTLYAGKNAELYIQGKKF